MLSPLSLAGYMPPLDGEALLVSGAHLRQILTEVRMCCTNEIQYQGPRNKMLSLGEDISDQTSSRRGRSKLLPRELSSKFLFQEGGLCGQVALPSFWKQPQIHKWRSNNGQKKWIHARALPFVFPTASAHACNIIRKMKSIDQLEDSDSR